MFGSAPFGHSLVPTLSLSSADPPRPLGARLHFPYFRLLSFPCALRRLLPSVLETALHEPVIRSIRQAHHLVAPQLVWSQLAGLLTGAVVDV